MTNALLAQYGGARDGLRLDAGQGLRGAPLLAAALCPRGEEALCRERLLRLDGLKVAGGDPAEVDAALAGGLREVACDGMLAAAACVALAGVVHRTGGVIGDPQRQPQDACGEIEDLRHGLVLCAVPGGPGFVADCTRQAAGYIRDMLVAGGLAAGKRLDVVTRLLRENGAGNYLACEDGSGSVLAGRSVCAHRVWEKVLEILPWQ